MSALFADPRKAERDRLSALHAKSPQPGDYWHEMFCPCFLVVAVDRSRVWFLHKTLPVGLDRWTWDTSQVQAMTKRTFKKRLQYSKTNTRMWCDVVPNSSGAEHFITATADAVSGMQESALRARSTQERG